MKTPLDVKPKARSRSKSRTAPKEVRRLQLIEATIACIAERGISGTTMAAVTGRAGLSMGIVSLHFESKENLLNATLTHLSQEIRHAWVDIVKDATLEPAEKMWAVAISAFDPRVFNQTKIAVWFAYFGEARYRKLYRQIVESYDDEFADTVRDLCQTLSPDGPVDAATLADTIESFGDGLWLNFVLYPEEFTRPYCLDQMAILLQAVFPAHFKGTAQ